MIAFSSPPISTYSLAVLGSCLLLVYTVTAILYRLYFHPLAKYPGPFWSRISHLPAFWHSLRQDRHVWLLYLQQQYGTTFRFAPDQLLMNTPAGVGALCEPKGNIHKSIFYKAWARRNDSPSSIEDLDPASHGRKRKVWERILSDKALRDYAPHIFAYVHQFCDIIDAKIDENARGCSVDAWSPGVDMNNGIYCLLFDMMGRLSLQQSFGVMDPDSDSPMKHVGPTAINMLAILSTVSRSPIAPLWIWLKPRGLDWLLNSMAPLPLQEFWVTVDKCLDERLHLFEEEKSSRREKDNIECGKDFLHYIVDAETGKQQFASDTELKRETELMIIAASDTTATTLSGLLFYLSKRPDIQERLAAEVRAAFPTASDIKPGPKLLSSCKYLRAVIQEGLRMTPAGPSDLPRTVGPGGTVIEDHFFPAKLDVSVSSYCLCHNETVYPDSFVFQPERWLVGPSSQKSVKLAESYLFVFSGGPRSCIGKNLAWVKMSVIIATLVHRFEMQRMGNIGGGDALTGRAGRKNPEEYQTFGCFLVTRDGPVVQFRRREEDDHGHDA